MKALLIATALALCSCRTYQRTVCRHEVLSQAASCIETYGADNVRIWLLRDEFGQHHAQVQVRTPEGIRWLDNTWQYHELKRQPRKWFKKVRRLSQRELAARIATITKEGE